MNDEDRIDRGPFKGWPEAYVALFMLLVTSALVACLWWAAT